MRSDATADRLARALLARRNAAGHWRGWLSGSALATATAVVALRMARREPELVRRGLEWLAQHQNEDGGWGDTTDSPSNLSTTALVWGALSQTELGPTAARAEAWLTRAAGSLEPRALAASLAARYGRDRTFSVPILTLLALTRRLGWDGWRHVAPLPFELAALPRGWFRALRLPVVSYAIPALIAIGLVRQHARPTRWPLPWLLRRLTRRRVLRVLEEIQPENGGFLEATPLTSFVVMSLIGAGCHEHPVVERGVRFLVDQARDDGCWPIDSDLATWVTTLSIKALARRPDFDALLPAEEREALRRWLLGQQYWREHPYTLAAPGGWAWTDLPGGVPDADDTAGALLALHALGPTDEPLRQSALAGVRWLVDLANRDGGIPTFCRGWGALPFDRSAPDLTAHALAAWRCWQPQLPELELDGPIERAIAYLERVQRADGSWLPLWFGSQHTAEEANPTYGTARVVRGLSGFEQAATLVARGEHWLLAAQNTDGGWGGDAGCPSSIEETGLALEALSGGEAPAEALDRGRAFLVDQTRGGTYLPPAPIGLYFARLWYSETLYPLIHSLAGLT